jgi:hypothetical protein
MKSRTLTCITAVTLFVAMVFLNRCALVVSFPKNSPATHAPQALPVHLDVVGGIRGF